MFDVAVQFETFVFFESIYFESIENDYFKIVFRPSNNIEWETHYMQKTANLTKAIAVMLESCTNEATQIIFDTMCGKTMAYDEEPETNQMIPRTLLNQSMLHLMMTLDRYSRLLGKRLSKLFVPNQKGVLDLYYVADLSS